MIARPPWAREPRGRAASHRQRLGHLEQLVRVGCPDAAGLLDQGAEDPLITGQRGAVGSGRPCAGGRAADLQDRHRHAGLRAGGQPLAQARPAVVLEIERDRADPVLVREERQVVGGAEHGLVAAGDHRVEAQAAAGGQRVHRHVPALGDERDGSRLARDSGRRPITRRGRATRRSRCSSARTPGDPIARPPPPTRPGAARRPAPRRSRRRSRPRRRSPAHPPVPPRRARGPRGSRSRPRRRARAGRHRDGTHGRPSAEVRDGFTPQTDPAKPIASRFNSAWAP